MRICRLQRSIFKLQTICSTLINLPACLVLSILVNCYPKFNYSSDVILSNIEFNLSIGNIVITGFISISFLITWNFLPPRLVSKNPPYNVLTEETNISFNANEDTRTDVTRDSTGYYCRFKSSSKIYIYST